MNKKKTKKIYKHHEYWSTITPKQDKNILKYNHGEKSWKTPFIRNSIRQINMQLLVIHYLHIVHLMSRKTNMIIIEAKII